ncbi:MAG: ABC transporter ATP-binding protein [Alphaproteobacteria bacterium]
MINVRNLSKSYGQHLAVDDISFQVSAGEVVGFLGPNGAGKTTTMRMLTGFLGPNSGKIEIDGKPLPENPELAKAKIGYLPENNPLYEDMTVIEYLDFIAEMRGMKPAGRKEQIKRNLELYGLQEVASRDIGELSKGYRQRVGLAQASLNDPPIMILDEPTSGLDPNQIIEIRNLIKEIGKTKTVILSTHNLTEVEATCSRILIINEGKIVADDSPEALEKKGTGAILHVWIKGEGDLKAKLAVLSGVFEVSEQEAEAGWRRFALSIEHGADTAAIGEGVFEAAVAGGWKLAELHAEAVSLEDVFTQLTKA